MCINNSIKGDVFDIKKIQKLSNFCRKSIYIILKVGKEGGKGIDFEKLHNIFLSNSVIFISKISQINHELFTNTIILDTYQIINFKH